LIMLSEKLIILCGLKKAKKVDYFVSIAQVIVRFHALASRFLSKSEGEMQEKRQAIIPIIPYLHLLTVLMRLIQSTFSRDDVLISILRFSMPTV
jgi:hypothetical protein